jgi:hypothetical protein
MLSKKIDSAWGLNSANNGECVYIMTRRVAEEEERA